MYPTGRTSNNHAVRTAAAMDDQQIAVCVCASSDADVGIIRIKDQIAGLGFAPRNIRAVAVLHGRAAASASFSR